MRKLLPSSNSGRAFRFSKDKAVDEYRTEIGGDQFKNFVADGSSVHGAMKVLQIHAVLQAVVSKGIQSVYGGEWAAHGHARQNQVLGFRSG